MGRKVLLKSLRAFPQDCQQVAGLLGLAKFGMNNRSTINSPPPLPRNGRPWGGIAIFLVAIIIALISYSLFRVRLLHKVNEQLNIVQKAGYPITLNDLKGWIPEVPSKENAAVILTDAFRAMRGNTNSPNLPVAGRAELPK